MTPDPMRELDLERGGINVHQVKSDGVNATVTLPIGDLDWLASLARTANGRYVRR